MASTTVDPVVETYQDEWELQRLVELYARLRPAKVLEIGAWHGGTLWHWLHGSVTVVVDDEMRLAETWQQWAQEFGGVLHLLRGRSQDREIVQQARRLGPYDFIFIDGDHSYDAVVADWGNYRNMVAPGGVIAFHDIYPRDGYGVSILWEAIKAADGVRYMEIGHNAVAPGSEGRCGIGILWPQRSP